MLDANNKGGRSIVGGLFSRLNSRTRCDTLFSGGVHPSQSNTVSSKSYRFVIPNLLRDEFGLRFGLVRCCCMCWMYGKAHHPLFFSFFLSPYREFNLYMSVPQLFLRVKPLHGCQGQEISNTSPFRFSSGERDVRLLPTQNEFL